MGQPYLYDYTLAFGRGRMDIPKWEIRDLKFCFVLANEWDPSILDEWPLEATKYEKLARLQRESVYENIPAGTTDA